MSSTTPRRCHVTDFGRLASVWWLYLSEGGGVCCARRGGGGRGVAFGRSCKKRAQARGGYLITSAILRSLVLTSTIASAVT